MNRRKFVVSVASLAATLRARLPIAAPRAATAAAALSADGALLLPIVGLISAGAKVFPDYLPKGWWRNNKSRRQELHLRYEKDVTATWRSALPLNVWAQLDLSPADLPYVVSACPVEWRRNTDGTDWLILYIHSVEEA